GRSIRHSIRDRVVSCETNCGTGRMYRAANSRGGLLSGEKASEDRSSLLPIACFPFELLAARTREFVILRLAIIVRDAPLRSDVAFLFELQQRGIERAVVNG